MSLRTGILALAVILSFNGALAQTALKPFQQRALDIMLASMEPQMRPIVRAQLEPTLAALNEEQVSMMLAGMTDESAGHDDATFDDDSADTVASEADLAFNRAQYEPAIRNAWAAQKSFDDFVAAQLLASCPKPGAYALWGAGWRYEPMPLSPTWPRASDGADLDVLIIGSAYVPQDGRYRFDFSQVRTGFSQESVRASIQRACAGYKTVGEEFQRRAGADMQDGIPANGLRLEQEANARVATILDALNAELGQQSPAGDGALYMALTSGERLE